MPGKRSYRLILAMHTCPKYERRAEASLRTWFGGPHPSDVAAFLVYGRDGGTVPRLEGHRIYVDVDEHYMNLNRKTMHALRFLRDNFDFEHVLKFDDDTYCNLETVYGYDLSGVDYGGFMLFAPAGYRSDYHFQHVGAEHQRHYVVPAEVHYAEGKCYALSRHLIEALTSLPESQFADDILEDVMIGLQVQRLAAPDDVTYRIDDWGGYVLGAVPGKPFVLNPVPPEEMAGVHAARRRKMLSGHMLYSMRYRLGLRRTVKVVSRALTGVRALRAKVRALRTG